MAIVRPSVTDDSGSGTNGTIFNLAFYTALLDAIDAAITAAWIVPTFNAAHYFGNGSMLWTLQAGDVGTLAYRLQGKTMTVVFVLNTTTVGGTVNTTLQIGNGAWGGYVATRQAVNACAYLLNGSVAAGLVQVAAGGTAIQIQKTDSTNFALSTNLTYVFGQITFEVN